MSSLVSPVGTCLMITLCLVKLLGREQVTSIDSLRTDSVLSRSSCCCLVVGRISKSPPAAIDTFSLSAQIAMDSYFQAELLLNRLQKFSLK